MGDVANGNGVTLTFKPKFSANRQLNVDFSFSLPGSPTP
jgi:hypothetical protein